MTATGWLATEYSMSLLLVGSGMTTVKRSCCLRCLPVNGSGALSGSLISFASARTCRTFSSRVNTFLTSLTAFELVKVGVASI